MSIPFTQFLRPYGQRKAVIDMPEEIEAKAYRLVEAGYCFEIEVLTTGHILMDCHKPEDDEPIALRLCENGPPVVKAVTGLVNTAHERLVAGWLEEVG